jgi:hypothetical protein
MWPQPVPTKQAKMRSLKQLVAAVGAREQQQQQQQQQHQVTQQPAEQHGVPLQPQQQQARKRKLKQQQQQVQAAAEEDAMLALLCEEDSVAFASNSSQQQQQQQLRSCIQAAAEKDALLALLCQEDGVSLASNSSQQQQEAAEEDALLALLCQEDGIPLASNSSQQHLQCDEPASAVQATGIADVAVAVEQRLGAWEPAPLAGVKEQAPARAAVAAVIGDDAAGMPAAAAAATSSGLGPAGLALEKQELGALPSQQQLQYWQQADRAFDAADLQLLLQQFMMPRQVKTLAGRANRSGRARPALVDVADRVTQQYPVLATALHGLLSQVQQEQQQQQQQQRSSSVVAGGQEGSSQSSKRKRAAPKKASAAAVYEESPAAVLLLRALRCLQLWESRMVSEPDMPTLLQRLAGVGSVTAAAVGSAAGSTAAVDVEEFVDLTGDDDNAEMDDEEAAAAVKQLQAFLAGEMDVLLVREQGRVGRGAVNLGAAAAVVVKMEAEVSD